MLKATLLLAGVVVIANGATFVPVARDARGEPDATVTLTERELRLVNAGRDNTGMTMLLVPQQTTTPTFNRAHLSSLGFDCSVDPASADAEAHYNSLAMIPRATYLALDTAADPATGTEQPAAGDAKQLADRDKLQQQRSRLRIVDADNDRAALRRRHPDRGRFLIVRGTVRLWLMKPVEMVGEVSTVAPREKWEVAGAGSIETRQLWVPRRWQPLLAAIGSRDPSSDGYWTEVLNHLPRFEVTLQYGHDLLPAIVAVRAM
jgi:hypothetical protein